MSPSIGRTATLCAAALLSGVATQSATVTNPILWVDVPDISIVRVDKKYYMSQTTMHMTPGVPIMESDDMVQWRTVGYCYSTLANNDALNLLNGKNAYGAGSWASSIRHKNGTFYVLVPSNTTGRNHLYSAKDVRGPWKETLLPGAHDPSLVLDDDGRNYVVSGSGNIQLVELNADLSGVKPGGVNKRIITEAHAVTGITTGLGAEGSQVLKKDGYYYIFHICWPTGKQRTVIGHRSKSIEGPYEGKVLLQSQGVAQGSVLQMVDGSWMGYLFQDNGSVGRSPWLVPVTWVDGWPVFNNGVAPSSFSLPSLTKINQPVVGSPAGTGIVTSDDFTSTKLPLEWQINHNPDNANWSLTQRPGFFRIRTGRVEANVLLARNTLTMRSFGPKSSGRVSLDVGGLKDGDVAGLLALQARYGYVGVKRSGASNAIVMVNAGTEVASVPLVQSKVFLRIDMDFTNRTDKATFFYSTDSLAWKQIGNTLQMTYDLDHFMGYRFGLFNYGTKSPGGIADFDWFEIGASHTQRYDMYPVPVSASPSLVRVRTGFSGVQRVGGNRLQVDYRVDRDARVEIVLYDSRGVEASRMIDRHHVAGDHSLSHAVEDVRSGRYTMVERVDGRVVDSRVVSLVR